MAKAKTQIQQEEVRRQLSRLWFIGSGIIFGIVVLQAILGRYGQNIDVAFSWFVPTTLPTLSLMLGVIGAAAMSPQERRSVKYSFYELAWWISFAYLTVLFLTLALEPFSPFPILELLKYSNYWLSPIQGLAVAAMSFVFASQKSE